MVKLVKQTIKSKKTGKEYVAYHVQVGDFEGPLFFPSKIESLYIEQYMKEEAHKDFKGDDLEDVGE